MSLLKQAIALKGGKKMDNSLLNRKDHLILTTIDIIDELGIQGLSTREVAKRVGMSNAVVFSHFKSKNELILAVLDYFTQYDKAVVQALHSKGLQASEGIVFFIDSFVTYYENYPAITALIEAYSGLKCENELSEKVKQILYERLSYIKQMVEEGQAKAQIRSDYTAECVADIILGSFRMICLKWRMSDYHFPLRERVLNAVQAVLDSFADE